MIDIKRIPNLDMNKVLELVWSVFLEYEAPDYTEEGINEFKKTIDNMNWINDREFYGAYIDNTLTGVIATKDKTHIALFFVEGKNHNKGIGRMLFNKINTLNEDNYMTVNSSLFAHDIYKHLGFIDTDTEQCIHGIKFYPMKLVRKKD